MFDTRRNLLNLYLSKNEEDIVIYQTYGFLQSIWEIYKLRSLSSMISQKFNGYRCES